MTSVKKKCMCTEYSRDQKIHICMKRKNRILVNGLHEDSVRRIRKLRGHHAQHYLIGKTGEACLGWK